MVFVGKFCISMLKENILAIPDLHDCQFQPTGLPICCFFPLFQFLVDTFLGSNGTWNRHFQGLNPCFFYLKVSIDKISDRIRLTELPVLADRVARFSLFTIFEVFFLYNFDPK